ncbi:MAG: methenyltetrahydromethanopterin cyclohydrolase [Candidatus Methanomethylicota archaeon]|uniref:Methenyltetrahydromethanopterin cyclohydrolase n=1 Tax=Thermoproteota archaeon TaxID=2056631 RepID=A0A497EW43_9CREN|nr:MAG: methenyltetrahydromethanopterin cyclohydrolase [Candidatus Verstraetearchaeota archaeon]
MISVNKEALKIVDEMISRKDELNVDVIKTTPGATVIDCGVKAKGGFLAGIYASKVCLGGLAEVNLAHSIYGEVVLPVVNVYTDYPVIACMASQYAGWKISVENYFAMGSGPARALSKKPKALYEEIEYEDTSDEAVIVLEASKLPPDEAILLIAEKCNVKPQDLYILVTPTNSIAGSVQISARIVETGIHKLHELKFDIKKIISGSGICPIAPVHPNPMKMMGRTNDMILYGGETTYLVDVEDEEELKQIVKKVPSSTSRDYGRPFYDIFKSYNFDFYQVDPGLFAPATITLTNRKTGATYKSGYVNVEVIKKSIKFETL